MAQEKPEKKSNFFIPGFSIALGFLLGGIVSPPDAVSVGAITRFVKIPRATATILEGESLLNDASSLIIFRFALVAVGTGQFVWQEAATSFLWMVLGGAAIGLILGWIFIKLHKLLPTDAPSDIALTFIEPYLMYWVAEELHSSGVLAVVAGGLLMSRKRLIFLNSASRIKGFSVWESFVFILNGVVFLIIGLQLPEIVNGIKSQGIPVSTAIGYSVLVTVILIVARMISGYVALLATMIFRPSVMPHSQSPKRRWLLPTLLGWTGMRGVVSLAAAMAIPVTLADGSPFPQRDLILFVTFVTILLTLVIQGLTLPYLIKRTGLFGGISSDEKEEEDRKNMKQGLKKHIYEFLKSRYETELGGIPGLEKILHQWEERAKAKEDPWMNEKTKAIFIELLESERKYLMDLNKDPNINEEMIRQQLYQLDLEEERLKII